MYPLDDTIVAVGSPPGGAARGIVRLSGPDAADLVRRFLRPEDADDATTDGPTDGPTAVDGELDLPLLASPLPCSVYFWPAGRSYTGQPVAELHTLGSRPLLEVAVGAFCQIGARMAEPGEFTLRAFLAGRIDLTQAEAVLGVIDAADPGQLDVALTQLAGGLAAPLHDLRDTLLDLLAHLEAGFDFADEDLPFISAEELDRQLSHAAERVAAMARQMTSRDERGDLIRVVLAGRPNAGKSSLFNALIRRDGALVSEQAGTTRDYLTADLDLDGVKFQLIDTAGVGDDGDHALSDVARAARDVAIEQRQRADVHILCLDATRNDPTPCPTDCQQIVVWTKADMATEMADDEALATSSLTGRGIDRLRDAVREAVLRADASGTQAVAGTALRCGESLRQAAKCLDRAREIVRTDAAEELVAAEIRLALESLGKVAGTVYTDDVLNRVFSRFCVGK